MEDNTRDTDSDLTPAEKSTLEVVYETENDYVVSFPDDRPEEVLPKTTENVALIEHGLYEFLYEGEAYEFNYEGYLVETGASAPSSDYWIGVDGTRTRVPPERREEFLDALVEDLHQREDTGGYEEVAGHDLYDLFHELLEGEVRRDVVARFRERFPEDRVEIREDGWVVDDTFLVTWDAENYSLNEIETYTISGGEAVAIDEEKEFVEMEFDIDVSGSKEVQTPDGDTERVSETELRFLAMVYAFVNAEEYFIEEFVREVLDEKQAREDIQTFDEVEQIASTVRVTGFTDDKSGTAHGVGGGMSHGLDKHTLRDKLNVTWDVIDHLKYNSFDHAGVRELWRRREQFQRAPFDVFKDTDDMDTSRWEQVRRAKESAPVGDTVDEDIKETAEEEADSLEDFFK